MYIESENSISMNKVLHDIAQFSEDTKHYTQDNKVYFKIQESINWSYKTY